MILPLCLGLVRHIWITETSAGLPTPDSCGHTGVSPAKGHKGDEGTGPSVIQGKAERGGVFSLEKRWLRGSSQCVSKYPMGGTKLAEPASSQGCPERQEAMDTN